MAPAIVGCAVTAMEMAGNRLWLRRHWKAAPTRVPPSLLRHGHRPRGWWL